MNQGPGENGLRWIADAYDISFTLTLAERLSPEELLRSVGAEERHIVPLTRSRRTNCWSGTRTATSATSTSWTGRTRRRWPG